MQKGSAQLLLIIVTILGVILGVYLYQNSKGPAGLETSKPSITKQPQSNSYLNQTLGFTFKYPNSVNVKIDTEEDFNKRGNGNYRKNFSGYVQYEPGKFLGAVMVLDKSNSYDTNPLTIWVFDNPNNLSVEKWYDKYWYYPFVWGDFTYTGKIELAPKVEATISGQLAKSGTIDYQPGKPKFIYVSKDKKMYLFRLIEDKDQTSDKVLSAFKFLE